MIKNKSGYCNKHRPRTGENNPFYGKHHSKEILEKAREKCIAASKKLWENQEYKKSNTRNIKTQIKTGKN